METKQGASKWIKVTWLKWPLHINVASIINNFGGKHIQLPARWSPLAQETANSHGVVGCEYHLTVVLPCVGLLVLSLQKWWSWLLSPIKRVEAVAALCKVTDNSPLLAPPPPPPPLHCVCFSAGLRALISGAEIWQSQQVMTEAVVRSHPEPQRRLAFQAGEGLVRYPQHKETLGKWCHCSEKSPPSKRPLSNLFDICKLLNFFWRHFAANFKDSLLRYNGPITSACHLICSQIRWGGFGCGDVCRMVTCNSRVKAAWKNPFSV